MRFSHFLYIIDNQGQDDIGFMTVKVQQEVVNSSDGILEIPQYGTKHSLNISVTAGIVLWHFRLTAGI